VRQQSRTRSVTTCSRPVYSSGEQHAPNARREPAPGLEPGTARLQGGRTLPHLAPTSNSIYAAAPTACLKPRGLTPFRVTNDVTRALVHAAHKINPPLPRGIRPASAAHER
jgi:hypothetical protein